MKDRIRPLIVAIESVQSETLTDEEYQAAREAYKTDLERVMDWINSKDKKEDD